MAMTEAQIRAQARYRKARTTQVNLKLHKDNDSDIIARLEKEPSKNGFVKRAIRAYMSQGGE